MEKYNFVIDCLDYMLKYPLYYRSTGFNAVFDRGHYL